MTQNSNNILSMLNFKEIKPSFESFIYAHQFIVKKGLLKFIFLSGIFFSILFCIIVYFIYKISGTLLSEIHTITWMKDLESKFSWSRWIVDGINLIIRLTSIYLFVIIYKYIVLILGSPIFSFLSEKTENLYHNKEFKFNSIQFIKDIIRSLKLNVINIFRQAMFTSFFLIIGFIPIIGWLVPWIVLRKDWYYYGFSMLDYSCERHKMNVKDSLIFIRKHNTVAIVNGFMFYAISLLPIIGMFVAPSYCVIAATLTFLKIQENEFER